ncbi:pyridoxamine 5'-phosphate oxidase family protein [Flavicella sp.]|uniref:pyridoxamine 5'-phosphate oxidase family protein n=1 Tax=Flavicella sp. TaxID=2957742 RepID=UPI003016641D
MGKIFDKINAEIKEFIDLQKMFFVGTAAEEGRVNVSPKGMDSFRVLGENKIIWLNLTGSGNETAAHLLKNKRMTIMFCAFEGKPIILRLYGEAKIYHERDKKFQEYLSSFPTLAGVRQIIEMDVDLVQSSCGYAVPLFDYNKERTQLNDWALKQGKEKITAYHLKKNSVSIDGFETKIK